MSLACILSKYHCKCYFFFVVVWEKQTFVWGYTFWFVCLAHRLYLMWSIALRIEDNAKNASIVLSDQSDHSLQNYEVNRAGKKCLYFEESKRKILKLSSSDTKYSVPQVECSVDHVSYLRKPNS